MKTPDSTPASPSPHPASRSSIRTILSDMRASRRAVCAELQGLPAERMSAETMWSRGAADVRFMLLRYADHEEEHALQVARFLDEFGLRKSRAQRILGAAEVTRGDLLAALVGLDDADLDLQPEGEWPLRRTLAHFCNAEQSYTTQVRHAVSLFQNGLPFEPPAPEVLPPNLDTVLDGTFADFLNRLDAARERAVATISDLPDEVMAAPTIWWNRNVTVEFRLMRFAHHEREHTAHVLKWRSQVGRTPTEAQHLLGLGWRARGVLESHFVGVSDDLLDRESPSGEGTLRGLLSHIVSSERYITGQIQTAD